MKFTLENEDSDLFQGCRLHAGKSLAAWRLAVLAAVALSGAVLPFVFFVVGEPEKAFGAIGIAVIGALSFWVVLPFQLVWHCRRQWQFRKPVECQIANGEWIASNELGSHRVPLETLREWKEEESMLLICQPNWLFYIVPKRVFQTEQEWEDLRNVLTNGIGEPTT